MAQLRASSKDLENIEMQSPLYFPLISQYCGLKNVDGAWKMIVNYCQRNQILRQL